jgi:hypothetical protein
MLSLGQVFQECSDLRFAISEIASRRGQKGLRSTSYLTEAAGGLGLG